MIIVLYNLYLNVLIIWVFCFSWQETLENVKKCKSFLSTLIKLASTGKQSTETAASVRELVKDLLVREPYTQETHTNLLYCIHVSSLARLLTNERWRKPNWPLIVENPQPRGASLTPSSICLYVVLGGQTGSRGIHQQIIQRAKLLTPTLPCAFPQGKKVYIL